MFRTSKTLLAAAAVLLVGALVSPAPATAQDPTTVTGCLAKGTGEGTFSITGEDGKSYALTSTTVELAGHVGHKVTVTGTSAAMETGAATDTGGEEAGMAQDTAMAMDPGIAPDTALGTDTGGMAEDAGAAPEPGAAAGSLNVTKLEMASGECK